MRLSRTPSGQSSRRASVSSRGAARRHRSLPPPRSRSTTRPQPRVSTSRAAAARAAARPGFRWPTARPARRHAVGAADPLVAMRSRERNSAARALPVSGSLLDPRSPWKASAVPSARHRVFVAGRSKPWITPPMAKQSAGQRPPVGHVHVDLARRRRPGERSECGDHEKDRSDLIDHNDRPAEISPQAGPEAVAGLGRREMPRDQKQHAPDHLGRPDQPVDLLRGEAPRERSRSGLPRTPASRRAARRCSANRSGVAHTTGLRTTLAQHCRSGGMR